MSATKPLTGATVLGWLLAFFGVVAAVDGAFVVMAERTFPGFSPNAYETGLEYNRVLAAAEAQRALGWQVDATIESNGGALVLRLRDRNGNPVPSPKVVADVRRPAEAFEDRSLALAEIAPGIYRIDNALPAPGSWEVSIRVRRPDGADYRIEQRFVVTP